MKSASNQLLFLLLIVTSFDAHAIEVAVVERAGGGLGGGAATVAQLNDDTFFDFTATLVDPSMVDSAAELENFDVVVLGGTGHGNDPVWTVAMANALKEFVEAGGGVLMAGFGHYNSLTGGLANLESAAILDSFVPGDLDNFAAHSVSSGGDFTFIELTDLGHPITEGLPISIAYGESCCLEYNMHALQPGDVSLGAPYPASSGPGSALIYREDIGAERGRSVYLGAPHLGDVTFFSSYQPGLRHGPGDQLFEQAVAWLASHEDADADGDGVLDYDDFCPETKIPESVPTVWLNPNHWALSDDDSTFDTVIRGKGKGEGPNRSYILEDTAGCSCEQIIAAQGLGYGHAMHGCSIGVMDDWVELVTP